MRQRRANNEPTTIESQRLWKGEFVMTRCGSPRPAALGPRHGQLPRQALSSGTGLWGTAVSSVVNGVVGVAAFEVLAKAPWRKIAVSATALGLRAVRAMESMSKETAEKVRLATADVLAEAAASMGEQVPPPPAADVAPDESH
ncbi:DUF1490 family protein [Mycobacterium sp.]|uniref:DUF1490 family protein n=1 Tax=Mycobacterium sp. TaxID=1785 RepID=UPI00345BCB95